MFCKYLWGSQKEALYENWSLELEKKLELFLPIIYLRSIWLPELSYAIGSLKHNWKL